MRTVVMRLETQCERMSHVRKVSDTLMTCSWTKLQQVIKSLLFRNNLTKKKKKKICVGRCKIFTASFRGEKVTGLNSANRIIRFLEANLVRMEQRGKSLYDQHTLLNFSKL